MGGTFDPIHTGHLILGEKAYEQLGLEKVLFMPSGNPPHKTDRAGRASDAQRVEMVRHAISDNPHFALSLVEMHDQGYTYTYHTLETLSKEHPDTDYYFIMGADSLFQFHDWKEPGRIAAACTLVVAVRDHTPLEELNEAICRVSRDFHASILRLETTNIDISSKMLRSWAKEGKSLRYYVRDSVASYIRDNQLYQQGE